MNPRAILRACAALALTLALASQPAEASNKRRSVNAGGRCVAAHAMAKKALKSKGSAAADAGFVVLPHPSGKVAISPRDSEGKYTRTVVIKHGGGSYTQLLDSQGAVLDTYSD